MLMAMPSRSLVKLVHTKRLSSFVVKPALSHIIETVKISGNGFDQNKELTICSTLQIPTEKINLSSYAHVRTKSDGSFDLTQDPSHGGSYIGIMPMGLFWTMTKRDEDSFDRMQFTNAKTKITYSFQVFENFITNFKNEECLHECVTERYIIEDGVERIKVADGRIRGTMFIPQGEGPYPAVITLQGGLKNKQVNEDVAAFLAANGFLTLALAFYGVDNLPTTYDTVDLTYFEEAVNFLLSRSDVTNKVGVYGSSKGGDLALGMIPYIPQIDSVVSVMAPVSSLGGKVDYKGIVTEEGEINLNRWEQVSENLMSTKNVFPDPRDQPAAIHPFYRSKADLFMVAGRDDQMMNCLLQCDVAEEVMWATGKKNFVIRKYDNLGHLLDLPNTPVCCEDFHPKVPKPIKLYFGGKDKKGHATSQLKVWQDVVDFFKRTLTPSSKL